MIDLSEHSYIMYNNQNGPLVPSYDVWLGALASSACIGFTSLVPWLFNMTFFEQRKQKQGNQEKDGRMQFLLSFAAGAILGDIFFHLIPESFQNYEAAQQKVGLAIISGILVFVVVETLLSDNNAKECPAGYLNLIANGFDNFNHGLGIGASFLIEPRVGLLTTIALLIHEIPHEICDYAILVNSGFSRWDAVKAQSSVSLFGLLGTALALSVKSVQSLNAKTVWIMPFSAGGFLYIALVNLLPEILDRNADSQSSLRQIAGVIIGIACMALVPLIQFNFSLF